MKNFFIFITSAVSTFFITLIMWWHSLGYYQPAEHWLSDVYFAKEHYANQIKGPKVIVVSGSNTLFGLDSQVMEKIIGKPVVNLAGHAGLPLEFLLAKALKHTNNGDLVVMPLEFGYYNEPNVLNNWQVSNMESWGHEYIKSNPTNIIMYFRYASISIAIERLIHHKPIPRDDPKLVLRTVTENSRKEVSEWLGYSYKSMNASGDILVESTGRTFNDDVNYTDGAVSEHALNLLEKYSKKIKEKGGELILTWPTTIKNPKFNLASKEISSRIANIKENLLSHGITMKCSPHQFQFDRDHFVDTSYHLNYKGAVKRTVNLSECLTDRIGSFSAENIYEERLAHAQLIRLADTEKRVSLVLHDLRAVVNALKKYYNDNGAYPLSDKWDGFYSAYGTSSPLWIKGLVPTYIPELPRDPRLADNGFEQYIYHSDGKDFKLISNHNRDCELIRKKLPSLVDPTRDCIAIGFWTENAKNW